MRSEDELLRSEDERRLNEDERRQKEDERLRKLDAKLAELDARLSAIVSSSSTCSSQPPVTPDKSEMYLRCWTSTAAWADLGTAERHHVWRTGALQCHDTPR